MKNLFNTRSALASPSNANAMLDALNKENPYQVGFKQGQRAARDLFTSIMLDSDTELDSYREAGAIDAYIEYRNSEVEYLL